MIWEYAFLIVRIVCLGLWYDTWGLVGMALSWLTRIVVLYVGLIYGWW